MARKSTIGSGFSVPAPPDRGEPERDTVGRVLAGLPGGHSPSPSIAEETEGGHMTDNMTSHMTDRQTGNIDDNTDRRQAIREYDKSTSQSDGQSSGNPAIPPAIQQIMQSVRAKTDAPPLKTVTIKMRVDRDDQVERHCFERKLKKQDVIENALALYFDAIAQIEKEGA